MTSAPADPPLPRRVAGSDSSDRWDVMRASDRYRAQAEEAGRRAQLVKTPVAREAYRQMAEGWLRLAMDAADLEERLMRAEAPRIRAAKYR
jgi:hypothetical protein